MEVPDIEAYVHPGEVLLTTLYPLRDDLAGVADLVRRLHAAALSALVVRLGRYVDHIPAAAVDAADELGFPIIVVDTHIAFNDVISAVLAIVLADYGPEPGRAETIRERLTAVALTGGGLAEIARTLAGALDRHVAVVDAGGATLGTGRPPTEPAGAAWPGSGSVLGVPDHGRRHRTRAPARRRGHRTDARPASTDPSGLLRRGHAHRPGAGQHRAGPPDAGAAARGGGDRQQPRPRTATGAIPLVRLGFHRAARRRAGQGRPGVPGCRCRQDGGCCAARRLAGVVAGYRGGRDRADDRCRPGRGAGGPGASVAGGAGRGGQVRRARRDRHGRRRRGRPRGQPPQRPRVAGHRRGDRAAAGAPRRAPPRTNPALGRPDAASGAGERSDRSADRGRPDRFGRVVPDVGDLPRDRQRRRGGPRCSTSTTTR